MTSVHIKTATYTEEKEPGKTKEINSDVATSQRLPEVATAS